MLNRGFTFLYTLAIEWRQPTPSIFREAARQPTAKAERPQCGTITSAYQQIERLAKDKTLNYGETIQFLTLISHHTREAAGIAIIDDTAYHRQ